MLAAKVYTTAPGYAAAVPGCAAIAARQWPRPASGRSPNFTSERRVAGLTLARALRRRQAGPGRLALVVLAENITNGTIPQPSPLPACLCMHTRPWAELMVRIRVGHLLAAPWALHDTSRLHPRPRCLMRPRLPGAGPGRHPGSALTSFGWAPGLQACTPAKRSPT